MDQHVQDLLARESDADTRQSVQTVTGTLESLRERIDKLGERLDSGASTEQLEADYEYITIITSTVEEGVQDLIRQKLIASERLKSQITDGFNRNLKLIGGQFVLVIGLSAWFAWVFSGTIARPLRQLSRSAVELMNGNLSAERVAVKRRDEIGLLCEAFNGMFDQIAAMIEQIREANGAALASSESILQSVRENRRVGEVISESTLSICESLGIQSQRIEASSGEFDGLFNSFRQIVDHARNIDEHAERSLSLSNRGTDTIKEFSEHFHQLTDTVGQADQETAQMEALIDEMAGLLQMIRNIASQTNILSINASIEATHETRTGQTFVVIAGRIKQLANQTSQLAADADEKMGTVRRQIGNMNKMMQRGMAQLNEGGSKAADTQEAFEAIRDVNAVVRDKIGSITVDLKKAGERMDKLLQMISDVEDRAGAIQQDVNNIAAMGEEQLAALEEVAASSDVLTDRMHDMNGMVSRYYGSNGDQQAQDLE
nr:methyl-accepting chemotaxis protein [Paenibacillus roseus]